MSILKDDRRFGTDEEREEWEREMLWEYRRDAERDRWMMEDDDEEI